MTESCLLSEGGGGHDNIGARLVKLKYKFNAAKRNSPKNYFCSCHLQRPDPRRLGEDLERHPEQDHRVHQGVPHHRLVLEPTGK